MKHKPKLSFDSTDLRIAQTAVKVANHLLSVSALGLTWSTWSANCTKKHEFHPLGPSAKVYKFKSHIKQ